MRNQGNPDESGPRRPSHLICREKWFNENLDFATADVTPFCPQIICQINVNQLWLFAH